jgi:hypothetical protein
MGNGNTVRCGALLECDFEYVGTDTIHCHDFLFLDSILFSMIEHKFAIRGIEEFKRHIGWPLAAERRSLG